jgi:hypothetical protein
VQYSRHTITGGTHTQITNHSETIKSKYENLSKKRNPRIKKDLWEKV